MALLATVLFAGCATRNVCIPAASGEPLIVEVVRSSGGVVMESSIVTLDAEGRLSYRNGAVRCVQLTAVEQSLIEERLSSPALVAELQRVADQNYKRKYHDTPHVLVKLGGATTFVPMQLALRDPLERFLSPLDELLRAKLGRAYRYPLLPREAERAEYRRMFVLPGDGS